jgi:hypothetical protein
VPTERITALLDTEIINPFAENLILIGDCQNTLIAEVKGQSSCFGSLEEGTGVIELESYNDIAVIIIGGKDTEGRRKAASALAKYKDLKLTGQDLYVSGTISFPSVSAEELQDEGLVVISEPIEVEQQENTADEVLCGTDSDCNQDEFCSQFGCLALECPTGFSVINHTCDRAVKQPAKILDDVTPDVNVPSAAAPHSFNFFQKLIDWLKGLFH